MKQYNINSKSLLLAGRSGTDKSFVLKQIVVAFPSENICQILPKEFFSLSPRQLNSSLVYVVDELGDISELLEIDKLIELFDLKVIAAIQLSSGLTKEELDSQDFNNFHPVYLDNSL